MTSARSSVIRTARSRSVTRRRGGRRMARASRAVAPEVVTAVERLVRDGTVGLARIAATAEIPQRTIGAWMRDRGWARMRPLHVREPDEILADLAALERSGERAPDIAHEAADLPVLRRRLRLHIGRQIAAFDAALRGEGAAVIDSARTLRDLGGLKRLLDDLAETGEGMAAARTRPPSTFPRCARRSRTAMDDAAATGRIDAFLASLPPPLIRALAVDWLHQARAGPASPALRGRLDHLGGDRRPRLRQDADRRGMGRCARPRRSGLHRCRHRSDRPRGRNLRRRAGRHGRGPLGPARAARTRRAPALVAEPPPGRMGQRRGGDGLLGGGAGLAARPAIRRRMVGRDRQMAPAGGDVRHAAVRAAPRRRAPATSSPRRRGRSP